MAVICGYVLVEMFHESLFHIYDCSSQTKEVVVAVVVVMVVEVEVGVEEKKEEERRKSVNWRSSNHDNERSLEIISSASAKSSVTVSVKVKSYPCCIVTSRTIPAHAACIFPYTCTQQCSCSAILSTQPSKPKPK